ncbi:hypothetical protein CLCR_11067 [Cladophialophora carrionii]|uniref:Uncharacterized protein n=1 Tax=Cladophialophora carrionii TaxID=86049 RepID=A0A1C1CXE6_9EURO|nr:hypothetical protein CLCR_11067 [Cladophialophora carrionii]
MSKIGPQQIGYRPERNAQIYNLETASSWVVGRLGRVSWFLGRSISDPPELHSTWPRWLHPSWIDRSQEMGVLPDSLRQARVFAGASWSSDVSIRTGDWVEV